MSENWQWSLLLVSLSWMYLTELSELHSLAFFQLRFFSAVSLHTSSDIPQALSCSCSQSLFSSGSRVTSSLLLWTCFGAAGSSLQVFNTSGSDGVSSVPFLCCVSHQGSRGKASTGFLLPKDQGSTKTTLCRAWRDASSAPGATRLQLPLPWDSHDKAMI